MIKQNLHKTGGILTFVLICGIQAFKYYLSYKKRQKVMIGNFEKCIRLNNIAKQFTVIVGGKMKPIVYILPIRIVIGIAGIFGNDYPHVRKNLMSDTSNSKNGRGFS